MMQKQKAQLLESNNRLSINISNKLVLEGIVDADKKDIACKKINQLLNSRLNLTD